LAIYDSGEVSLENLLFLWYEFGCRAQDLGSMVDEAGGGVEEAGVGKSQPWIEV